VNPPHTTFSLIRFAFAVLRRSRYNFIMSHDYRIFIGAFPGGALADQIQAMREQYDPKTARITAPHVTLAGTYCRSGPATAETEADLIARFAALDTVQPFTLTLGDIHTFGRRVIYLGVAATPALLAVRHTLLALAGPDKHGARFTPHLTLAMRLKGHAFTQMLADLQESVWDNGRFSAPIDRLHLMQRGPADPAWRTIATLPLA
jgi:2'-5' RNA ligase